MIKLDKVKFTINSKDVEFSIIHNLAAHGLGIKFAVENWLKVTNKHNARSLCKYINKQGDSFMAITHGDYKRYLNAVK